MRSRRRQPTLDIDLVTFTFTEDRAVSALFEELSEGSWRRPRSHVITTTLSPGRTVRVTHRSLLSQGNVVAATSLASVYRTRGHRPALVVFYGCAGGLREPEEGWGGRPTFVGSSVAYLSLGTVEPFHSAQPETTCRFCWSTLDSCSIHNERNTLKSKWLERNAAQDVRPLPVLDLLASSFLLDVLANSELQTASIVSTDSVVRVKPWSPSDAEVQRPTREWSYGRALRFALDELADPARPAVVEMEGYGIASAAASLDLTGRAVVMRVVTDQLVDHGNEDNDRSQQELLQDGTQDLAAFIYELLAFPLRDLGWHATGQPDRGTEALASVNNWGAHYQSLSPSEIPGLGVRRVLHDLCDHEATLVDTMSDTGYVEVTGQNPIRYHPIRVEPTHAAATFIDHLVSIASLLQLDDYLQAAAKGIEAASGAVFELELVVLEFLVWLSRATRAPTEDRAPFESIWPIATTQLLMRERRKGNDFPGPLLTYMMAASCKYRDNMELEHLRTELLQQSKSRNLPIGIRGQRRTLSEVEMHPEWLDRLLQFAGRRMQQLANAAP